MLRRFVWVAIVLAIGSGVLAQEATKVEVSSKIKAVTVFYDRAMVKRTASHEFTPGVYTVEVSHLPGGLLDESIRVSGEGTAKAKILGVEIKPVYLEQAAKQNFREAGDKLYRLKLQIQALNEKAGVLNQQKEFVNSIGQKTAESINKDLPVARPSVAEWSQMVKFIGSSLDSLNQAIRQINEDKNDLEAKCNVARDELQILQSHNSHQEKSALISVAIENSGSLNLEVRYIIMGATWTPLYDVRVNSDTKEAEVTYFGNITQTTGEDWESVKLTLSTAKTSVQGQLPELTPLQLDLPIPMRGSRANAIVPNLGSFSRAPSSALEAQGAQQMYAAQAETSLVANIGISTTFELIQKESIASGNKAEKVTINVLNLKGDLDHITIPKLSETVYLKAKIKNTSESPLLAGKANIFYDGDFVSSTAIPTSVSNESFELFLGVDQGMKIKRELVEKFADEGGLGSSKDKVTYEYKISINNYRKTEEKITVIDQIPVSQNDEIEVNLKSVMPPVNKIAGDDDKGYLRWTFSLKPSEQKDMQFKYEIKYPKGARIDGLN